MRGGRYGPRPPNLAGMRIVVAAGVGGAAGGFVGFLTGAAWTYFVLRQPPEIDAAPVVPLRRAPGAS